MSARYQLIFYWGFMTCILFGQNSTRRGRVIMNKISAGSRNNQASPAILLSTPQPDSSLDKDQRCAAGERFTQKGPVPHFLDVS